MKNIIYLESYFLDLVFSRVFWAIFIEMRMFVIDSFFMGDRNRNNSAGTLRNSDTFAFFRETPLDIRTLPEV